MENVEDGGGQRGAGKGSLDRRGNGINRRKKGQLRKEG